MFADRREVPRDDEAREDEGALLGGGMTRARSSGG